MVSIIDKTTEMNVGSHRNYASNIKSQHSTVHIVLSLDAPKITLYLSDKSETVVLLFLLSYFSLRNSSYSYWKVLNSQILPKI